MNDKETAFYSAALQAWITTRMERDKSVLILSVLAICFLVIKHPVHNILFVSALFSFMLSSIFCIIIFGRNAKYLENIIKHPEGGISSDKLLIWLDKLLILSFFCGISAVILIGLSKL